jgi:hypothetical protein
MRSYLCIVISFAGWIAPVQAQEFRISTRVYNESTTTDGQRPPVISRSLSLFHAGKVYDYIDTINEVIIFEPAHQHFTILNPSRNLASSVHFDELKRLQKIRAKETVNYLSQLSQSGDPESHRVSEALKFQLEPTFAEQFEEESNRLTLTAALVRYSAVCVEPRSPGLIEPYLHYADWMAKLNSTLHPQALYPESRLALNRSLRTRNRLPIEVELQCQVEPRLHLRAQHVFVWKLDDVDRRLIHKWETMLKRTSLEKTTFREYQRRVLITAAPKKR